MLQLKFKQPDSAPLTLTYSLDHLSALTEIEQTGKILFYDFGLYEIDKSRMKVDRMAYPEAELIVVHKKRDTRKQRRCLVTANIVSWQGSKPLNDPESSAKPSYCRLVLHYLEWLAAVEELATLDEKRRLKLTTKHMIATILLTISFNTFKYGSVHLLLCNGFFFPQKRKQTTDRYRNEIEVIVNELERNVVNRLRELKVCEEEYVLLKLVLLFSHSESLGEKHTETTRRLHGKYDQILLHYVKHSQGNCSVEELIDRISSLFELLTSLNSISEMAELCLVHIVALDIAGMRGKLTFDLHLRQHQ
ncbi:Ligand-binding domain of nuclear hormone receptor [Trichostrongylus colubriformis]|uniref:Ligand-binding domain of nuclear hormone receptor n=1 Tax=Trichostrongylus colubriformis TaxID=6319 RepID=A0AAN8FXK9_TRICO